MKLNLKKRPKNPIIIEGFPGFGLVGVIASEFLVEHLNTELIGKFWLEELPATVAIHDGDIVNPVSIYYNKKHNLVIIHAIAGPAGHEWHMADMVLDLAKELEAKEIVSLEGVGSLTGAETSKTFYYTNNPERKKRFEKAKIEQLKEGIIMGVTSALLLKSEIPISGLFAETHTGLPDSKAAAKIIEALDKYLELNVDYEPLLKMAEKFEQKLKKMIEQGAKASEIAEKKRLSYVG